jgi:hypothetical protein
MYTLHNIQSITKAELEKDFFLVIYAAGKVPPHIFLLFDSLYYSLGVKGSSPGKRFGPLLKNSEQKNIPLLLIRLQQTPDLSAELLYTVFATYSFAGDKGNTCLSPVKEALEKVYATPLEPAAFVFELLPLLEQQNRVEGCFELHAGHLIQNSTYTLPVYTLQDIQESILPTLKTTS